MSQQAMKHQLDCELSTRFTQFKTNSPLHPSLPCTSLHSHITPTMLTVSTQPLVQGEAAIDSHCCVLEHGVQATQAASPCVCNNLAAEGWHPVWSAASIMATCAEAIIHASCCTPAHLGYTPDHLGYTSAHLGYTPGHLGYTQGHIGYIRSYSHDKQTCATCQAKPAGQTWPCCT